MNEKIQKTIDEHGIPGVIYFNSKKDITFIKDFPQLEKVKQIENPARYKKGSVTMRYNRDYIIIFETKKRNKVNEDDGSK